MSEPLNPDEARVVRTLLKQELSTLIQSRRNIAGQATYEQLQREIAVAESALEKVKDIR